MKTDASPERKALLIMAAIGTAEIFAIWAALRGARPGLPYRLLLAGHPAGWLSAVLVSVLFIWLSTARLPMIREHLLDIRPIKLAGMVFGVLAAVGEELWFRRIPMDLLARANHGPAVQVLAAALLFGLAHAVWGLFGRQWRSALAAMIATGLLGAALALVYLAGGRAIAPCIWSHAAINLILEPWLLLAVLSRRSGPGKALGLGPSPFPPLPRRAS
ncbi:MAG TPA: CPBP family intramembrane glutamic endopeptidase [Sphingomicrobium sp.]|nr:CPBP family intramembrane glutamic endopeptidase [Sphingomicrobium sp.]